MQRMFVFLLLAILFPLQIFAGIGDTDNRYYVTDEMWAKNPYKKFVHMTMWKQRIGYRENKETGVYEETITFTPNSNCSAQYISPNLILSAGHCTDKKFGKYTVKNYKKESIEVKLVYTEYTGETEDTLGDWAIWLVTDPKYYSDAYFDIKVPTKTTHIINAGWGWARIIKNEELDKVRELYDLLKNEIYEENSKIEDETKKKSVEIVDLAQEISKVLVEPLREKKTTFKASKCTIMFEECQADLRNQKKSYADIYMNDDLGVDDRYSALQQAKALEERIYQKCKRTAKLDKSVLFPDILATTCDSWQGNSGGGYISNNGKYLYGTCSYGQEGLESKSNSDYIVSAKQFNEKLKELIKTYDSKNPVEENIGKIPENVYQGKTLATVTHNDESTVNRSLDLEITDLTSEVEGLKTKLDRDITDIPNMTNEELLSFLDKLVEHDEKKERLEELQKVYEEAKANEQSLANRTLTALTVAATGLGGMELARGLAEQKADKEAEADMTAYIETMRCTYGDGKQVKAGPEEIELPGGNDLELTRLRTEYFALAKDLKERKEALGMKPGIESETILDKSEMGLYDDESIGITDGAYSSLYRAKMLESETDQAKIDEDKEKSKKRVIAGGVLSGVGVAGGMIGNSMINGKLGEMIKENKNSINKNNKSVIDKLKKGLKSTGMTNVDKLDFSNLDLSSMSGVVDKIDFSSMSGLKGKNATEILNTSNSSSFTSSFGNILGDKNSLLFQ